MPFAQRKSDKKTEKTVGIDEAVALFNSTHETNIYIVMFDPNLAG